ncbi:hypothetical protein H0H87_006928 [Tephrocybe sp. NHM501043]|nr:hypothetical protein H0H87_006928 [Tephrocybe sp. NHM501043]
MPDIALDAVRSRSRSSRIINISAKEFVKHVLLKRADGFAEETCTDKQDQVGHDHQEDDEEAAN